VVGSTSSALDTFHQECAYGAHLGLQALLVPSIEPLLVDAASVATAVSNFARMISRQLGPNVMPTTTTLSVTASMLQLWMTVPLVCPSSLSHITKRGWSAWNQIRRICDSHPQLSVALDLSFVDESTSIQDLSIAKWNGEPVKAIIVSTQQFSHKMSKKTGRTIAVLPTYLRKILKHFTKQPVNVILRGRSHLSSSEPTLSSRDAGYLKLGSYIRTIEKLWMEQSTSLTEYDLFCMNYRDSLRAPLQPLADHLDSQTYTIMEQDPVKYFQYEAAVKAAIRDLLNQDACAVKVNSRPNAQKRKRNDSVGSGNHWRPVNSPLTSQGPAPSKSCLHVLVVGPGRGPLIKATLRAAAELDVDVNITAVEKNPNAVATLRNRALTEEWSSATASVTIYCSDMRHWRPDEHGLPKADIVVSELLGSWGDNECSPECLDVVLKNCVKIPTGICIPYSYTSYVAPLMSSKLWNCARVMHNDYNVGLETPYVVELFNKFVTNDAKAFFKV
jgi:protein arginine N-methyltransferase 5